MRSNEFAFAVTLKASAEDALCPSRMRGYNDEKLLTEKIMIAVEKRSKSRKKELPPLQNGDHLDQKTFHERYEAMPPEVRAELIGGIVYMSSPQKMRHGRYHLKLSQWLAEYEDATPGVEGNVNATQILGPDAEPQPDACLLILPSH